MTRETHFDVVVVGSGYGGAVVAHRLAEAGLRVCVLERGKAYPPGSFPRSPNGVRQNFWDPSEGLHGLFDVWSFRGLAAVVSSGLGGGSLLTSNVLIRKDEDTFVEEDFPTSKHARRGYEHWPVTRADLDPHYDAVEKMLGAARYPWESITPKTRAMREGAEKLGKQLDLPHLAVTFATRPGAPPRQGEPVVEEHRNLHDRTRSTCRLCGECNVGCNYGSKNTLDYNYLSSARRLGAELRTRCEVRTISRREGGGYRVQYVDHGETKQDGTPSPDLPLHALTAKRVVLAAGALGSTFLLLKNRHHLPGLSDRLGSQISGNGDLLAFLDQCRDPGTRAPRRLEPEIGPVITSSIRFDSDRTDPARRGFYLEDAGYPQGMGFLVEAIDTPSILARLLGLGSRVVAAWLGMRRGGNLSAAVSRAFGDAARSSSTLPLLAMGRDVPDGRATLDARGALDIDWAERGSDGYFAVVRDTARRLAEALGGTLRDDPIWIMHRLITVHPLGGAPMGRDVREGVVDSYGEVFGHPGLFVADGSIMPGPVGANPSLTIAAMADRIATRMLGARGAVD